MTSTTGSGGSRISIAAAEAAPVPADFLLPALRSQLGAERVLVDEASRRLHSEDVYRAGAVPLAVLRPRDVDDVVALVRVAGQHGVPLFVRGGGMSYTDAFTPTRERTLVVDLRGLDRIREINDQDLHATVEAGLTWAALDEALAPRGLRAIFWGPMSGRVATIGGSMSQGAATFGSGRHGTSAAAALAFEVVLGDGSVLHTGLAGAPHHNPFFRSYGPDLTGLFTGDAGALGIKTAITLQLEPRPALHDGLSFAFADFDALHRAVAAVARRGLATEIFGIEGGLARLMSGEIDLRTSARTLLAAGRAAGGALAGLKAMTKIALAGRGFLAGGDYVANFVAEGPDRARLDLTLDDIRGAVGDRGREVANTMAQVVRATPFPPPQVLGPGGRRLLPLHVILPPSRIAAFHEEFQTLRRAEMTALEEHGVLLFGVFAQAGPAGFLYEPVIYWEDEPLAWHREVLGAEALAQLGGFAADPAAREYVEGLRVRLVELMFRHGGAHLQIGRAYPFLRDRPAAFVETLRAIKRATDPQNVINPGALGLPA